VKSLHTPTMGQRIGWVRRKFSNIYGVWSTIEMQS